MKEESRKNKLLLAVAVGAATNMLLSSLVSAQEERPGARRVIEEVLVEAQKREQSSQDIPIAVSALTSEDLLKTNTTEFADLSKVVPGLYINGPSDGFGQGITIRGVGSQPFVSGIRPGVTFIVNDVPLARLDSIFTNLSDVERLEVLKGPQSTLYGREASSGVISIVTKKPSLDGFSGDIGVEIGSNDTQQTEGRVNIPLGDRAALSLSAYHKEFEGEITNVLTGKKQSNINGGGRVSFLYQPTDTLEILLRYGYSEQQVRDEVRERVTLGQASLAQIGSYTLPIDPFDEKAEVFLGSGRDIRTQNASLHIDWDINDSWALTSITGYTLFDREIAQGDPLPFDITGLGGFGITVPAGTPTAGEAAFTPFPFTLYGAEDGSPANERTRTQEFRVTYEGERLSSLYGAFYSKADENASTSLFLFAVAGGLPLNLVSESKFTDWSVFTHHTLHLTDKWDLIFGVRYGETTKDVDGGNTPNAGVFGDGTSPLGINIQKDTWDNISGTLKVVYAFNDDVSFYGGIAQGYKPGGFNDTGADPGYDEETTLSYEMGVKGLFFEQQLRLNLAAYYQTYDDYQVQSFDPETASTANIVNNAASVEVEGVELDFLWIATDNLSVEGAIAYTNARFDSFENAPCTDAQQVALAGMPEGTTLNGCTSNADTGVQDLSGKRLFENSPFTGNLGVQYEAGFSEGISWYARGDAIFRDDYYGFNTLEPAAYQGSYTLYDASFGLRSDDGKWEVSLFGKNLSDEDYIAGFLAGRDGLLGVVAIPGLGRTVGLKTKYHF